jgi:NitT/TauT family transport system substrate-binding protein
MPFGQSRRSFLSQVALGAAGMSGLATVGFGSGGRSFAAEPPPEVTTVTLEKAPPAICVAPEYVAEDLLRAEGFTDIRYRARDADTTLELAHNQVDWTFVVAPNLIANLDNGAPLTLLAGVHIGCLELIAHEHVRSIAALKGRTVGWSPSFVASKAVVVLMAKLVGLDPDKDIHWVDDSKADPKALFIDRQIDAFLSSPPETLELRARGIGHSLVNTATDRPWSRYYCCMVASRTEFVQKYPIASKRILRALLKATDLCAAEPERVARQMVERGFTDNYDYNLQTLQELPYAVWRDFDPEDSVRFFALRLNEAGFIKLAPDRIIAEHTDWRFLNELKRELKT